MKYEYEPYISLEDKIIALLSLIAGMVVFMAIIGIPFLFWFGVAIGLDNLFIKSQEKHMYSKEYLHRYCEDHYKEMVLCYSLGATNGATPSEVEEMFDKLEPFADEVVKKRCLHTYWLGRNGKLHLPKDMYMKECMSRVMAFAKSKHLKFIPREKTTQ